MRQNFPPDVTVPEFLVAEFISSGIMSNKIRAKAKESDSNHNSTDAKHQRIDLNQK